MKIQTLKKYRKFNPSSSSKRIFAASDFEDGETIDEAIEDMADTLDNMADNLEEVKEDYPNIPIDNNISDHYIAECDNCQSLFISTVTMSEQKLDSIRGVCPECQVETDQYLKWVIKDVKEVQNNMSKRTSYRDYTCPVCGKHVIQTYGNIYKFNYGGKLRKFCGYNCYTKALRLKENKQTEKLEKLLSGGELC